IFSIHVGPLFRVLLLFLVLLLTGIPVHAHVLRKDLEQSTGHLRYAAHSPLRISGSVAPLLRTPSMSSSPDPIMKSTCTALRLPPACSNSVSLISLPFFNVNL